MGDRRVERRSEALLRVLPTRSGRRVADPLAVRTAMSRPLAGRHRLWFFSVALPMWFSQGCLYVPHLLRGAPIEFRVVDDTTGAPLSNVVVTANWQRVRLNLAHTVDAGHLVILETASEADRRAR